MHVPPSPRRRPGPSPKQRRRFATLFVRVWAPAFAGVATAGCGGQIPILPHAIVSNNPCIDGILAEIAAPGQIGAVSVYSQHEASSSAPLAWARAHPALGTSAEEIIAAKPRLVLTGNYASTGTNAALARAGIKMLAFGVPATIAESKAQVMRVAHAIGRDVAGEALVARIDGAILPGTGRWQAKPDGGAGFSTGKLSRRETGPSTASGSQLAVRLAPSKPQRGARSGEDFPTAIIWQSGGFVPGKGTLQDELLTRAGFRNASASYGLTQWQQLPLETLIRNPPSVIFMPASAVGEDGRALSARLRLLAHLRGRTRIAAFPDKLLNCGGPSIIQTMRVMRGAF